MDYTVHGVLQARILEWLAFPFSRGSSQSRDWTQVSHTAGGFFTSWAIREAQQYWSGWPIPSPVDLPNPGIELGSPALQVDSLPTEPWGKPSTMQWLLKTEEIHSFPIRELHLMGYTGEYKLTIISHDKGQGRWAYSTTCAEKVLWWSLSRVWLFVTPWNVARQALLSMELSKEEYWSG